MWLLLWLKADDAHLFLTIKIKSVQTIQRPDRSPRSTRLEFAGSFGHLLKAQVHHKGGEGILSLLAHVTATVFEAGVQGGNTQHDVRWDRALTGQLFSQPSQQLHLKINNISSYFWS